MPRGCVANCPFFWRVGWRIARAGQLAIRWTSEANPEDSVARGAGAGSAPGRCGGMRGSMAALPDGTRDGDESLRAGGHLRGRRNKGRQTRVLHGSATDARVRPRHLPALRERPVLVPEEAHDEVTFARGVAPGRERGRRRGLHSRNAQFEAGRDLDGVTQ